MIDTEPHPPADQPRLRAARWVRPDIRRLAAYGVHSAAGLVKLDAMENPYGWPAPMVEQWLECLRGVALNRYPDPDPQALKSALAEAMQVPSGQSLLLGNGSDELIQLIALALAVPGACLMAPEPSFVMYRMIARFAGMEFVGVPLDRDFALDRDAALAAVERHQPAAIFLAYPNNPTGNLFDAELIEELVARAPGLVVVDEAYHPFAGRSFMPRLSACDNLLVMRTLSKMGLAGLRLGVLAGPAGWLDQFDKLRLPYNINVLTQASARFALSRSQLFADQAATIRADRGALASALAERPGLEVFPSEANFLMFRVGRGRAPSLFEAIRAEGVLIKLLDGSHPALADCLRVTVGTAEENRRFLVALDVALG